MSDVDPLELASFLEADTSDRLRDQKLSSDATKQRRDADERKRDAAAAQAEQANKLRTPFFWFGVAAASCCVLASAFVVGHSQLYGLRDAGVLTEEEFTAKKAELLSRL